MQHINSSDPALIWKYDQNGNERPLQEQVDRRKADLKTINNHISWYSRNPIINNQMAKQIAHQERIMHKQGILEDIKRIEQLIKQ